MNVLVTGAAGFVGYHVVRALAARGERVLGVDSLDGSPSPALTAARLARLEGLPGFSFRRADLAEPGALARAAEGREIERAIHLAGRAGLRGADPAALARDNVEAHAHVLAFCREHGIRHLVHASSSAVYGGAGGTVAPRSAYGDSKRRAEQLARNAAAEAGLPVTTLRYFTLYGPWSRPDTAAWIFADAILAGRPVQLHGHGRMRRAFTFVDDAAAATLAALDRAVPGDADGVRHAVLDVRRADAVGIEAFLSALELALGRRADRLRVPAAPGEVIADSENVRHPGLEAPTALDKGLARFAAWYLATGRAIVAGASGSSGRPGGRSGARSVPS